MTSSQFSSTVVTILTWSFLAVITPTSIYQFYLFKRDNTWVCTFFKYFIYLSFLKRDFEQDFEVFTRCRDLIWSFIWYFSLRKIWFSFHVSAVNIQVIFVLILYGVLYNEYKWVVLHEVFSICSFNLNMRVFIKYIK